MPDRSPRSPSSRRRSGAPAARREPPWLLIAAVLAVIVVLLLLVNSCGDDDQQPASKPPAADPGTTTALGRKALSLLRPDPRRSAADLTRRAQAGFANPLYRMVPGGAILTAARVATYRPLIEDVAKKTKEDPNVLEALVYLESAGRPDAMATESVTDAAGFTQIVAETGTSLLGMKIDLKQSASLTKRIASESRRKKPNAKRLATLRAARIRADPRFDPRRALEATAKYLDFARGKLGDRDDLAVASYHMGVGNLQNALKAYGKGNVPYVQLYFGVDPLRSPKASALLMQLNDDSSSYYWRIGAAERIMRQFRHDPPALEREAALQTRKASSEDLLHPPETTKAFADPAALERAERTGVLIPLPVAALRANGVVISKEMGELAGRLDQPRSRYRALRPGALAGLLTIGATVRALDAGRKPATRLTVTSSVRDEKYQALLGSENVQATHARSQHTTGWAFDVGRQYAGNTAQLFQWTLTRLQAMNLIAWVREPTAIHVTFSSVADRELRPVLTEALGKR